MLTYFIKCKDGSLLKDKITGKPRQVSTWTLARKFAQEVGGKILPHHEAPDEWTDEDLEDMREAHEHKPHNLYNDCYHDYLDKGISPYDLF